MVLVPSEEGKVSSEIQGFIVILLCDPHWLLSPSGGSGTKFSSGATAPGDFGGTVSIQAVHLKPQELEILASLKMPFCAKFNYTRTVVSQTLAFCGGFCGSY